MKIKNPILTEIYTAKTLRNPQDFFERLRFKCEYYPELIPEKCGFWEPFKIKFSPEIIDTLIPDDRGGQADTLYWNRTKRTRAWGALSVPIHDNQHSKELIHSELEQTDQNKLIDYVKKVCHKFDADLAIIDMEVEDSWRIANPHIGGIHPTTNQLEHWLPDMYWGVVFGKPYVDLWGKKLFEVPAFKVEKLSDDMVFIQLTADISDLINDPEQVRVEREKIKTFLNNYVFYSPEKGYQGNSLWFFAGRSEDNLIWIPRLGSYPKIFNTPHFILGNQLEDDVILEPRIVESNNWEIQLAKEWLTQSYPPDEPDLSTGTVEQIRFFFAPESYDSPIDKELFIGAWDRPNQNNQSIKDFAEISLHDLSESYPTAVSSWTCLETRVEHHERYSEVYLDQADQQEMNLFRIAVKMIIFEKFFVKVTFMDYWCIDLEDSKKVSYPLFSSFKAKTD
ncbi:hypothetical protein [Acinetobacter gerneri]|uniref:hypothetical protein n=1 Tax=Acinetobacter gerneri TaxID=202952 RepID=UPI003A869529